MKGRTFFRCPDCGKNSVYMKLGVDDGYCCRTSGCWFWAYASGSDTVDVANRARLRGVNARHPQAAQLREVDFSQPGIDTTGLPQSTVDYLESVEQMLEAAHGKVQTNAGCLRCGHPTDWVYDVFTGDNMCSECGSTALTAMDMNTEGAVGGDMP